MPNARALANPHLTLRSLARPEGERLSCVSSGLPRFSIPEHGVEDGKKLSHASGERELLRLSCGEEAAIEACDDGVVPAGDESGHVQSGADGFAPTPDGASAAQGAAVAIERGDADEGGDLLAI